MTFKQDFEQDFSSGAFQTIDGEMTIVGKWGRITQLDDGKYDLWLVKPNLEPISKRKLTNLAKKSPLGDRLTILEGEAYTQGAGREFVLEAADLAGVRKKRKGGGNVENLTKRAVA